MKMKTLIAVAIAGAFAVPFAAQASADGDRIILAQSGSGSAGGQGGASQGGAAAQGGQSGAPAGAAEGTTSGAQSGQQGSQAGTGTGFPPTSMQQLDANNDGYLSRDEAMKDSSMTTRFSELDRDNDGRISRSEWDSSAASGATSGSSANPAADTGTAASRTQPSTGEPRK